MDNKNEVWLPIPVDGLADTYSVSNFGRIKRTASGQGTKCGLVKTKHNKRNGYIYVTLCTNNTPKTYSIHRLVCLAFHGIPAGADRLEVAHNDGCRQNCHADNLRWVSRSENWLDSLKHGTAAVGERSINAKLTAEDVCNVRQLVSNGVRRAVVASQYGISRSYVGALVRGDWRKHDYSVG